MKKIVIALVSVLVIMGITIGASNAFDAKAKTTYEDIEKFPDSYKSALYALKEKHPNWTFEVMETGLDWSTVVANEMNPDYRSLVPTYFDSKFVGRNYGDGWACATQEAVEYYLDPRNWLTEDYIFQFEKLTYNDGTQGIATVQKVLQNTFMSGYIQDDPTHDYASQGLTYAQAFFDIGEYIKVSPVHLATRVKQEQGTKGTSDLISGVYPGYEGYYNYYNIQASGKTHEEIVRNGLNEAKSEGWNNRYAALIGGSQKLANRYILRGQDTLYLQKFDVDGQYDGRYWHQYMQNLAAPSNEGRNTKKAYASAGMLDEAFIFKIPVYKNMPGMLTETDIEEGYYILSSGVNNSLALSVEYGSVSNGDNINVQNRGTELNQIFSIKKSGSSYIISAAHSGKNLDVDGWSTKSGTNVQQWENNGGDAQKWIFYSAGDGYVYVKTELGQVYLTMDGSNAGSNVNIQNFTGNNNQKFKLSKISLETLTETSLEEGTYAITSKVNSELVLDISGGNANDGANLDVQTNSYKLNQKFILSKLGEAYTISAVHSQKSLDVDGWSTNPGTNVQQWSCNGGDAQKWRFYDAGDGYVYVKTELGNMYLTVDGSSAGANVNIQYFTGSDNQKFKFDNISEEKKEVTVEEGMYTIASAGNEGFVLDVAGGSDLNGTNVDIQINNGGLNQRFNIGKNGEAFLITAVHSGKSLDVDGWFTIPGTNVQQWETNGGDAQKWKFYDAGDGYVYIKTELGDLYLTCDRIGSGCNVNIQYYNGSANQKFKLNKINDKVDEVVIEEGTYVLTSAADNTLAFDISEGSGENGANLGLANNSGLLNQRFKIAKNEQTYIISAIHSGKCLDVDGWSTVPGTNVQQWDGNSGTAQRWRFYDAGDGYVYIKTELGNLYLTANGTGAGSNINIQYFTGGNNQKFRLNKIVDKINEVNVDTGVYTIASNTNTNVVLNIADSSTDNGANVDIKSNSDGRNQMFAVEKNGETYTISALHSGKRLDVDGWFTAPGTNVQQWEANGGDAQSWRFYDAGDGYVYIRTELGNLYLTVAGTNVDIEYFTGESNQKFKLISNTNN